MTGKPRVADRYGAGSQVAGQAQDRRRLPASDPGHARHRSITVTPDTTYYDAEQPVTVSYLYKGNTAGRRADRAGQPHDRRGSRQLDPARRPARQLHDLRPGTGRCPTSPLRPAATTASASAPPGASRGRGQASYFSLYDHKFPIRGKHQYGDGVGAPRKGHTHQGQDVFAKCGTPLVAARGGKVQCTGYHAAAGNYVVIDGKGTRPRLRLHAHDRQGRRSRRATASTPASRSATVGETGNATGCHLHFEIWSAPGWYEGGEFLRTVDEGAQEVGQLELRLPPPLLTRAPPDRHSPSRRSPSRRPAPSGAGAHTPAPRSGAAAGVRTDAIGGPSPEGVLRREGFADADIRVRGAGRLWTCASSWCGRARSSRAGASPRARAVHGPPARMGPGRRRRAAARRLLFRVGPEGGVTRPAGGFRLRDHLFPIRASHSLRRPLRRAALRRAHARGPGHVRRAAEASWSRRAAARVQGKGYIGRALRVLRD